MIAFACPKCGKRFTVADNLAGRKGRCPSCQSIFQIPGAPPAPGQAPPSPPPAQARVPVPPAATQAPVPSMPYDRPRYRPPAADQLRQAGEDRLRKRNLTILGVVLLAGFFLPILVRVPVMPAPLPPGPASMFRPMPEPTYETRAIFLFVELFRAGQAAPWELYVLVLAPFVAGVCVLAVARAGQPPLRGLVLVLLGLLPAGVLALSEEVRGAMAVIGQLLPSGAWQLLLTALLGQLGVMAVLVGARTRWYRPRRALTYWIGLGGAAAYVIHLILPVLPPEQGSVILINTLKALAGGDRPAAAAPFLLRLGPVLMMLCFIAASVACAANAKGSPATTRKQAYAAFLLLAGAAAAMILCLLIGMTQATRGEDFGTLFLALVKGLCMAGGLILLIPVGAIDLIVGNPHTAAP